MSDLALTVNGRDVRVPAGATVRQACEAAGERIPTLCFAQNLTPATACRVCVVEIEGQRTLAPSCGRAAEAGMKVQTDSPRVRNARRVVLELLASSADVSAHPEIARWSAELGADPARFGPKAPADPNHGQDPAGEHHIEPLGRAAHVDQPILDDNTLYVRDYARCIQCYKCADACGEQAQGTFAIAMAGRGFGAHIATPFHVALPASACVYCGNCIAVCPTAALQPMTEHRMRQAGTWAPERQTRSDTICPYCGVGCTLTLNVQDGRIVKVTSPADAEVNRGQLCLKGRFGFGFVHAAGVGDHEDVGADRPKR